MISGVRLNEYVNEIYLDTFFFCRWQALDMQFTGARLARTQCFHGHKRMFQPR